MNREIMKQMGFTKELQLIDEGRCPWCKKKIDMNEFRTPLSKREFEISGLCQSCQDGFFKGGEDRKKRSAKPKSKRKCRCK
jgi:hypothetical protein